MHGQARIHHIFHKDNIPTLYLLLQRNDEFQFASRSHACIGTDAQESDITMQVQFSHQIRRKDECAIEHNDDQGFFSLIIGIDLVRHLLHIASYLLCAQPLLKGVVLFSYYSHGS